MIPGCGAGSSSTPTRGTPSASERTASAASTSACAPTALGIAETDEEILALFDGAESIRNTLERDPVTDKDEALYRPLPQAPPGEPTTVESARNLMQTLFRNPKRYDLTRVGRQGSIRSLAGPRTPSTAPPEGTPQRRRAPRRPSGYLIHLHAGTPTFKPTNGTEVPVQTDDIDHFGNRRVRTVGELIQNQVRVGLTRLERVVRERMTTQDPESITPQSSRSTSGP